MFEAARRLVLQSLLLIAVSIAAQGAYADTQSGRLSPWRIERDILRFGTVATDNVMDLLAIRPGMTILDIGAGTGQFAYEFARRLNGTGKVYATDQQGACIDYIRQEAARRGLRNLQPVLVRKEGLDEFYRKQRYDLITVFHTYMVYEDRVDYLRGLRRCLADNGRLVLILYKIPTLFSSDDFTGDFRELINAFLREPVESPYYRILKDSTRNMIRDYAEGEPPGKLRSAIVDDFNGMLSDPRFRLHFFKGSVFGEKLQFLPDERRYADWALPPLPDNAVRIGAANPQNAPEEKRFAAINKLLIIQRYRTFLKREGRFRSGFTPQVKAAFENVGFRVAEEYPDVIPFEDMIFLSAH